MDKLLAQEPLAVPVMLVHSLWDQEDIYGAPAVYRAIEPKDTNNDKVFIVMGPWHHGQEIAEGSSLGALKFGSDTALYFRQQILRPFLDHYLKDEAPKMDVAPVTAFETGTNTWRRFEAMPKVTAHAALPGGRPDAGLLRAESRRRRVRGVRLRSVEAGAVPRASEPAGRLRAAADVAAVAG